MDSVGMAHGGGDGVLVVRFARFHLFGADFLFLFSSSTMFCAHMDIGWTVISRLFAFVRQPIV